MGSANWRARSEPMKGDEVPFSASRNIDVGKIAFNLANAVRILIKEAYILLSTTIASLQPNYLLTIN